MKRRKYLYVEITRKDGSVYSNPLKLNETHLITALLKHEGNSHINGITLEECSGEHYKNLFG